MTIKELFKKHKSMIESHIPNAEIEHVGGTAIDCAKTKGDLDISVCVEKDDFNFAQNKLHELYIPKHSEIWSESFSVFYYDDFMPIDIILVVKKSKWDTFVIFRDILKENKNLLDEYNLLKDSFIGKDDIFQHEQKKRFYGKVLSGRGLEGY